MNFGISDISYMFAMSSPDSYSKCNCGYFYGFKLANIFSDIRLLLSGGLLRLRCDFESGDLGKGSLSLFNNIFKFHAQMPDSRENLNDGTKTVLSSTQPSEKGKSQLYKLLQSALKKADEKEAENKRLKTELYWYKYFISRSFYFNFSLFEKNNPVDKCDWKKLYEAEIKLREAER